MLKIKLINKCFNEYDVHFFWLFVVDASSGHDKLLDIGFYNRII